MKPRALWVLTRSFPRLVALVSATAGLLFAQPAPRAMADTPASPRLTATHTHRFTVPLPLAEAFTLFEPMGEKRWAEGWMPVFATPDDAALSDNTVFTRTINHPGEPPRTSVWLITRYDRAGGVIEYRTIVPDLRVSRITVTCQEIGEKETAVTVTYRHTSLSDEGTRFLQELTPEKYRASIEEWATAIRAYLIRGTPATP